MRAFFRMEYDFDYAYQLEGTGASSIVVNILVIMFWRILTNYALKGNLLPLNGKK